LASRKIETSDPKEINGNYLVDHLGLSSPRGKDINMAEKEMKFARPKRPGRKN
jgi:twinfilin